MFAFITTKKNYVHTYGHTQIASRKLCSSSNRTCQKHSKIEVDDCFQAFDPAFCGGARADWLRALSLRKKVKRHAALVLGNVCQSDAHRVNAGKEGAVEGLFSLCDTDDDIVRANALWALGKLAWNPYNQVRLFEYAKSRDLKVVIFNLRRLVFAVYLRTWPHPSVS